MLLEVKIAGTGAALPATRAMSSDLDRKIGRPEGWLFRHTGVWSRYYSTTESQVDLAVAASRDAMDAAGVSADEIDLVLFTAAVPYQTIPATAPLIQQRLGIGDGRAAAFDINSTCLSFLTAVDFAAPMLATGRYRHVLVVASEIASRALPWEDDPKTAALFGDGAAAAVLSAARGGGIVAAAMETYPAGYEACRIGSGGTRYDFHKAPEEFARHSLFEMDGDLLFKLTIKSFPQFLDRLLQKAGWTRQDVDLVVPHQASPGALAHLARKSGFRPDIVVDITREHGNQVAASLPTALHKAVREGRVTAGSKVLLLGTSAGVSFGGLALVA